jgi:hypothetical protein
VSASPEQVAEWFHEAYERLAPLFGYETRRESAVPWDAVPTANRLLMIEVAREVLAQLEGSRRVVRENRARVPAGDLQLAFVNEARTSMGQPDALKTALFVGKHVRISFNHIDGYITGWLTAIERPWIVLDGDKRFPLMSLQSIAEEPIRILPQG